VGVEVVSTTVIRVAFKNMTLDPLTDIIAHGEQVKSGRRNRAFFDQAVDGVFVMEGKL